MLDKKFNKEGSFFMSKYSKEFKLKVIEYYLSHDYGYMKVAKHFKINHEHLRKWVKKYQEHGLEGLSRNKIAYDGNFKQYVVEYMHENHLSLAETCIQFNLGNHYVVSRWERIYYEEGPQALYKEQRGRNKKMSSKPRKKKLSKEVEEDLIAENQRLRMENEYLKKLNALVQERIKRENKRK